MNVAVNLEVRAPHLGFTEVPRHWFAKSAAATHVVNGVNLLFPAGERFFSSSVLRYSARLQEEGHQELAARTRGFFGQEGRHASAHEKFFETMRAQGYEIDAFLAWYQRIAYRVIEKNSPHALSAGGDRRVRALHRDPRRRRAPRRRGATG